MTHLNVRSLAAAMACGLSIGLTACVQTQSPAASQEGLSSGSRPAAIPHDFARWEGEVAAYEAADRASPPPKGGVLFVGSSTIRMWSMLAKDFPDHKVLNRGVGGCEIADVTHFADRIVFPYEPKQVFLRAGGNDIHAGRLPDEVARDFADFVEKVHGRLPNTGIVFISLSPAPARWGENDKIAALNKLVRRLALFMPRVSYLDTYGMTVDPNGSARSDLFIDDQLHFNAEGYKLLAERVRPYLTR